MASKRGPRPMASQPAGRAETASSLPAAAVLSFLKETRGISSWNLKDLTKSLRISAAEAKRAAALVEVQGYIERTGDGEWLTTVSGNSISGSQSPRFTSEAVEQVCPHWRNGSKRSIRIPTHHFELLRR